MYRRHGPTRRRFGRAMVGLGGSLLFAAVAGAQRRPSKGEARYQDHPRGIQMCSACTLFLRPHACKVVEGDVSPDGWCRLFDMAD